MEVFMSAGGMDAARRMDIVYAGSLAPFASHAGAIVEAIYSELPGMYVTLVPSFIGDMCTKFLSVEDRELAINHHPFSTSTVPPFISSARRRRTASPVPWIGSPR
jgi:hypothetical protein